MPVPSNNHRLFKKITIALSLCLIPLPAFAAYSAMQQGVNFYKSGNYKSAINSFNHALVAQPNDSTIEYYLGNCYARTNKRNEAVIHFQNACKNSAADTEVYKLAATALGAPSQSPAQNNYAQSTASTQSNQRADALRERIKAIDDQLRASEQSLEPYTFLVFPGYMSCGNGLSKTTHADFMDVAEVRTTQPYCLDEYPKYVFKLQGLGLKNVHPDLNSTKNLFDRVIALSNTRGSGTMSDTIKLWNEFIQMRIAALRNAGQNSTNENAAATIKDATTYLNQDLTKFNATASAVQQNLDFEANLKNEFLKSTLPTTMQFPRSTSLEAASRFLAANDYKSALPLLLKAKEESPYNPAVEQGLAKVFQVKGDKNATLDHQQSAADYQNIISHRAYLSVSELKDPYQTSVNYLQSARSSMTSHEYGAALLDLERAEAANPSDSTIQFFMGKAYQGLYIPHLAIKHYLRANNDPGADPEVAERTRANLTCYGVHTVTFIARVGKNSGPTENLSTIPIKNQNLQIVPAKSNASKKASRATGLNATQGTLSGAPEDLKNVRGQVVQKSRQ